MLSKWHVHADDIVYQLVSTGKVEIVAVWDEIQERGKTWASELGVDYEPTLNAVLTRSDVQAVVCCAPTTMHKEILVAAARAGKHIFTEKVLATNSADAGVIAGAVKDAGIVFVISYPLCHNPLMCYAKKLIDAGEFGKISMIRARRSHGGLVEGWLVDYWFDTTKTGGGAMMDLGAHPMYLLSWLCGKPKRISGVFNNLYGTSSDENSVALIEFENGIIGVSETSFVSYNTHDVLEIYGTDATLLIWGDEMKLTSKKNEIQHQGYLVPSVEEPELPSVFASFVDACLGLAPVPACMDIDAGVAVSLLMEGAYKSNGSNTTSVV